MKTKKQQDDQYDIQLCLVQSPYQPKSSLSTKPITSPSPKSPSSPKPSMQTIQQTSSRSPSSLRSSMQAKSPSSSSMQTKTQSSSRSPSSLRSSMQVKSPRSPLQTKTHSSPRSPSCQLPTSLRTKEQKTDQALHNILIRNFNFGQEDVNEKKEQIYNFVKDRADTLYQNKVSAPVGKNEKTMPQTILSKFDKSREELERLYLKMSKPENMSPGKLKKEIKKTEKEIRELDEEIKWLYNENKKLENIIFKTQNSSSSKK